MRARVGLLIPALLLGIAGAAGLPPVRFPATPVFAGPTPAPDPAASRKEALDRIRECIAGREKEPAETVFKNIDLLRGKPADRLPGMMSALTGLLGVECAARHVPGNWASDELPAKKTARLHFRTSYNPAMSRLARRISGSGLATFLILAAPVSAQDPSTWAKFSPPASRFSMGLPGIPTEGYEPETGTHTFEIRSGDQRTMVSWRDLPKEALRATPEQILEGAQNRFLKILPGAKLLRSVPAKVGESPGLTWMLDTSPSNRSPLRMKGIAVLAKRRLFIAAYMENRYRFDEAAADRILATFEILE